MAMMHSSRCPAGASSRTSKPEWPALGFADRSHLRYYASRARMPAAGSGFFEMKIASDESVAEVIRQLEELQARVKSKKQGQRKGSTMKTKPKTKSKSCKGNSSSSSSSESSSDEDECGGMNMGLAQAQTGGGLEAVALASLCTKVEVCTGGKCRKNGSQQVLAAFQAKGGCVAASACKCMGKCDSGPNVRLASLAGGSVVHSGVTPEDVDGLLGKQESYCYL